MSLQLLLGEDSQAKYLVNLLRIAGHDVITVNEAGLGSCPDSTVFNYARQQGFVVLTRNCDDFEQLHQAEPIHPGILAVYQNSLPNKVFRALVTPPVLVVIATIKSLLPGECAVAASCLTELLLQLAKRTAREVTKHALIIFPLESFSNTINLITCLLDATFECYKYCTFTLEELNSEVLQQ